MPRCGEMVAEEEGARTMTLRLGKTVMAKGKQHRVRNTRWGIFLEWRVVKRFTGHFIIQMVWSGCITVFPRGRASDGDGDVPVVVMVMTMGGGPVMRWSS